MSKKDDRRTSILKPFEETVPEVNKTKRRVSFHTHRTVKEFNKADMGGDQTPKNESIHYSGSSEEKSSFFGGNRPGSALTYTSHQTTDIVMNDKDFTMNSTANVTMAMFDRVAKRESRAIDDDATNVVDPTIAVFGNLIPFSTPIRNTTNYQEDQTLAFIEKFVPTERLTPEVRASPKRIAELYEEITCPIHISSPTSDKNPYNVDEDVAKAFKSCQLSPVKHRQEAGGGSLEFDLENDDHYAAEELLDGNKTLTMPQRSSSSPTSHALPMNSTYVVTASSVEGMYLPDESETINPISDPSKDKTYVVDQMKDDDIEMNDTSRTSSTTNSFHAPQHSEITKKKFRRLSDIINREKRRSSILSAAASSAANSPAIPEETAQQPSTLTVVNATINLSIAKSTINKSVANCSLDVFDEPMETTEAVSSEENVDDSLNQHDSVFENTFEQKPKQRNNTSILKNGTMLLEDVRTPTKYLEDSNFTIPVPPCDESFPTVHQPNDSEKLQKSDSNKSVISQKSVLNQTFEVQSEVSKIMPNGLPAIDKRYIRKEEAPKVNQTPGWAKYSKCLEIMKKMSEKEKKEQAIAMEDFDEEPNYLHGDSVMLDPTTPKKLLLSSSSYRQSYRDRNLEEPTESFFDDKENLSGIVHNNSTYRKSSNTLEHKSFQMSRLGCVGRQFAPDKAFFIEKVIKEVRELKCLVQNLNIDLPGIDNVIPELLIYDEILVITYYKLIIKIAIIDTQFSSLNNDKETWEKLDDLKIVEEKLEGIEKAVDQVVDELKLTSFTYAKFLEKNTAYLVRLSSTNSEAFETFKKNLLGWNSKVDRLKEVYVRRVNEMNQEMKAQLENEKKVTALMERKFLNVIEKYGNALQRTISDKP